MDHENAEFHEQFLRLFTANEAAIRAYVRRLVPTRDDAADVMQGISLVLWKKFAELDELDGFTVETPAADVVDFGTEFSVDVAGGSLRVLAESTGRGGRVETSPPLRTGQFTLAAFVYLESGTRSGIVASNIRSNDGNFGLGLDENGFLQATIRNSDGDLLSVSGAAVVALHTWRHVVMTVESVSDRTGRNREIRMNETLPSKTRLLTVVCLLFLSSDRNVHR
jgi:hypothetical protein